MKRILSALIILALVTGVRAQTVNLTVRNKVLVNSTQTKFEMWAAAGTGYVSSPGNDNNPSGSWTGLTVRFDIDIASTNTVTGSFAVNTAIATSGAYQSNPTASATSSPNSDGGITISNSANSKGDFTATPVMLGTVTLNFTEAITGANRVTIRQSQAASPDPTSWWVTGGALGVNNPIVATSFVLPVNFASFTGVANGCMANLTWATASEQNSKTYAIEYSTDGSNYVTVGTVPSANSAKGSSYSYGYNGLGSATGYFRIKAVDFDGAFIYSPIVSITGNGGCSAGMLIKVSPNPTANVVNIQGVVSGSRISLIDAGGKKINEVIATGTNQSISLGAYASGIYTLRIQKTDGTTTNVKVVKQ